MVSLLKIENFQNSEDMHKVFDQQGRFK